MRPAPPAPAPTTPTTFWQWNSPLPYLFGGLGLMLLLIAAALILLAYSYRKQRPTHDGGEKAPPPCTPATLPDRSPKIVVIMAGDDNPTHLAIPIASSFSKSAD
ncbi:hypothetical protein RD792_016757 [Penstemon davidsonii]|uniref:Uncharacterized protein n=1 Tax=Penstemon davidsonii TaxID=160366 RepID=A0ABR0CK73_9LAMI|nr:hypothetical protein RD792_016757 [Penstemon davidsonii]